MSVAIESTTQILVLPPLATDPIPENSLWRKIGSSLPFFGYAFSFSHLASLDEKINNEVDLRKRIGLIEIRKDYLNAQLICSFLSFAAAICLIFWGILGLGKNVCLIAGVICGTSTGIGYFLHRELLNKKIEELQRRIGRDLTTC